MPSSGYGCGPEITPEEFKIFMESLQRASRYRLEIEWLGCFISAIQQKADFETACWAGIEEWDL